MDRPFADKRPLGPFAQSGSSGPDGVALVYTTDDLSDFPSTGAAETALSDTYMAKRDDGNSDVVAAAPNVEVIGSPRADTRGVKVTTDVTIMNMDQFNAVKDATDEVMDQFIEYSTVAVAVPNP